jgi:hypothetical protein
MAEPDKGMMDKLAGGFKSASDGASKFGEKAKQAVAPVQQLMNTFEQLSNTGNRFGNDMLKIAIAASDVRMPLDKFTELLKDNAEVFASFGGSVSKGSQEFVKFAKEFHTSGVAENLRQMGFTAGELNEILALQVGFQKSTFDNSVEGQKKAAASAAQFALELDQLTQLTGVSRKEQEDNLKKAQADMKLEAKFREIGLEQGAEKEAEAREAFKNNYAQMAAKGMGDMYKELVATGTVMSKGAQAQFAMSGQAGQEAAKSAQELAKGNGELSKTYTERAGIEMMKLQRDKAFLRATIYATGDVGEASRSLMKANDAAYHGMQKTMKEEGIARENVTEALNKQKAAIKAEQEARVGITSALITGKQQLEAANAAFMNRIVGGVNKDPKLNQALLAASDKFSTTKPTDDPKDIMARQSLAQARQKELGGPDKAPRTYQEAYEAMLGKGGGDFIIKKVAGEVGSELIKGITSFASSSLGLAGNMINAKEVKIDTANIKELIAEKKPETGRAGGTLGETGMAVEPKDIMALLHKGETVLTPEQQKTLISNVRSDAMAEVLNKLMTTTSTGKQPEMGKLAGIDLQKIAKDIATTTSKVEITNWPKTLTQVAASPQPADKKDTSGTDKDKDKDKDKTTAEKAKEKEAPKLTADQVRRMAIEGQQTETKPTQASVRAVDNQIELNKQIPTQASVRAVDNMIEKELPSLVNMFVKDQEDELEKAAEQFQGVFKEMIPIQEMQGQQSEFKSKFTDEQKKFIEDYQGMSKDNQEFMTFALKRQHGIDAEIIEKHDAIVADLQKKKNERELTEEEEARLAESEMISAGAKEDYAKRQEQLDMIKNIEILADDLELERLDQQARKELELMKGADEEKLDISKAAHDLLNEQFMMANQELIGDMGGVTDAAEKARETFMMEINEMFDMPDRDEFAEDEYGEGGEAIGGEMDSAFLEDEYGALEDLTNQIQGLKEFEEDEYGEGGEAIGGELDSSFAEDEYGQGGEAVNDAVQNLMDQVHGLKEFEEDEYGEGGESIGGDDAGDDYSGTNLLDELRNQIPTDSMAEDAAYASGPGDASVAGIDFAVSSKANTAKEPVTKSNFEPITMDGFTLGPDGLPVAKPKTDAKSIPGAVKKDEKVDAAKDDKSKKDTKESDKDKKSTETTTSTNKKEQKTLDDVVKSLDTLNSSMRSLVTKVDETSRQQISAVKSLSGNLYKG